MDLHEHNGAGMRLDRFHVFAIRNVPHDDRRIFAAGHQELIVGRERQRPDPMLVLLQFASWLALGHVPELDRAVVRRGGHRLAVGGKRPLLGHLLNGYDTRFLKRKLRGAPRRPDEAAAMLVGSY